MKPLRIVAGSIVTIVLLVSGVHAQRVGLTETWVDGTRPLTYRIEGGSEKFPVIGEICDLMQPFAVEGGGVTVKFSPKSNRKGSYVYSGKVDGIDVNGRGTYEVQYDGRLAIGIVVTGPNAREGMATYRLKPAPGACRA
jgi:hypothetical protein